MIVSLNNSVFDFEDAELICMNFKYIKMGPLLLILSNYWKDFGVISVKILHDIANKQDESFRTGQFNFEMKT